MGKLRQLWGWVRRKRPLVIVFGVVGAILVVLVPAWLLEDRPSGFVTGVQASTTILLVFITGVYAYLTYRLVKLQENPPYIYRQEEQKAVSDLVQLMLGDVAQGKFLALADDFPLEVNEAMPPAWLQEGIAQGSKFVELLRQIAWRLPLPLQFLALASTIETYQILTYYYSFMAMWVSSAPNDGSPVDAAALRQQYEQKFLISGNQYPDWVTLLRGDEIKKATDGITDLRNKLLEYTMKQRSGVNLTAQ